MPARFSSVSQQPPAEEREASVLPLRQVKPDAESFQTSVHATAECARTNTNHRSYQMAVIVQRRPD